MFINNNRLVPLFLTFQVLSVSITSIATYNVFNAVSVPLSAVFSFLGFICLIQERQKVQFPIAYKRIALGYILLLFVTTIINMLANNFDMTGFIRAFIALMSAFLMIYTFCAFLQMRSISERLIKYLLLVVVSNLIIQSFQLVSWPPYLHELMILFFPHIDNNMGGRSNGLALEPAWLAIIMLGIQAIALNKLVKKYEECIFYDKSILLLIGLAMFSTLITGSRIGTATQCLFVVVYILFATGNGLRVAFVAGIICAAIFMVAASVQKYTISGESALIEIHKPETGLRSKIEAQTNPDDNHELFSKFVLGKGMDGRYLSFLGGVNIVIRNPITGIGLGQINANLRSYYPSWTIQSIEGKLWVDNLDIIVNVKNLIIKVASEGGILCALFFIGFIFYPLSMLHTNFSKNTILLCSCYILFLLAASIESDTYLYPILWLVHSVYLNQYRDMV